jgi:signal recognition particle subunit SRP54
MDSSAKGGGALTACNETNAPVYFIGTGEKPQDIEQFNPSSFISRILGLGDLESLVEKVKTATEIDEKKQKKLQKKLQKGNLNLRDLQEQLKGMKSMGSLSKIAEMIPGFGKAKIPENLLGTQEEKLKKWQHAIDSMTEQEINNPELMEKQTTRIQRIAKGSGTNTSDIRQLLKQYKMIKEFSKGGMPQDLSKGMNEKQLKKLAKKFGRKLKF